MNKNNLALPLLTALLLSASLAACNKPESPAQTSADVAKAEAEGARDVAKAENKMMEEHNDNVVEAVKDQAPLSKGDLKEDNNNARKVEMERAEADYKIAKEKCGSLSGDAKDTCEKHAKTDYETAKIAIEAAHDITKTQINGQ